MITGERGQLLNAAELQPRRLEQLRSRGVHEARLVAAIRQRDRKAAAELVTRYADPLYAYLSRRLFPRTELCDDILQEVFLAALDALPRIQQVDSLRAWLFGIARHKVEEHYRWLLRAPQQLDEVSAETATIIEPLTDDEIDRARIREKTQRVLRSLPESYSAALLWRYWEKRSAAEMAERTGKTVKAIERLLARARAQFKRRWHEEA